MLAKIKAKYQEHRLRKAQKREERKRHIDLIKNSPSAYDEALIYWVAPETVIHVRGPLWKTVMGILVIAVVAWGIYDGSWTFSLVIGTFAIAHYLIHLEHPKATEIKISDIGIKVGTRKYSYSQIKAFWIIYEPPYVQTLNIRVQGKVNDDITIQLWHQSPSTVREFLMGKIPELEGQSEKLSDIFLRLFKI